MKRILWLAFLFLSFAGYSQNILRGKIVNSKTKEALPFVNIAIKSTQKGTTSDVEGRFSISWEGPEATIQFSFVGFQPFEYHALGSNTVLIKLIEHSTELKEVVIRPGDNPALRIIRKAIENKSRNDPENLPSFRYNAYNKLYLTLEGTEDSIASPLKDSLAMIPKDTLTDLSPSGKRKETARKNYKALQRFADRNHVFVTESYTERKFLEPNFSKETVLARSEEHTLNSSHVVTSRMPSSA